MNQLSEKGDIFFKQLKKLFPKQSDRFQVLNLASTITTKEIVVLNSIYYKGALQNIFIPFSMKR